MKTTFENVKNFSAQHGFACNAAARKELEKNFEAPEKRVLSIDQYHEDIVYALRIGGMAPGAEFNFKDELGRNRKVSVCGLYDLPEDMVNPMVYCFSGFMTAPFYTVELIRTYCKKTGIVLPVTSTGKEGNKGLFEKLFYREDGLIRGCECSSYLNILHRILGDFAYEVCNPEDIKVDIDTTGNFEQMYKDAGDKATIILCSGNAFYTKRLVAEAAMFFGKKEHCDKTINIIVVQCPCRLHAGGYHRIPEEYLSEIFLGYIAAAIGPLMKDTITVDGKTASKNPERYFIPGLEKVDWDQVQNIIENFSNMGWPNYQEILYGVDHEDAVTNILLSHLYAVNSYEAKDYDKIERSLKEYIRFLGGYRSEMVGIKAYLLSTPDKHFYPEDTVSYF